MYLSFEAMSTENIFESFFKQISSFFDDKSHIRIVLSSAPLMIFKVFDVNFTEFIRLSWPSKLNSWFLSSKFHSLIFLSSDPVTMYFPHEEKLSDQIP